MTNELEKTFFDTFGIEPKKEYYCPNCETKLEKWNTPKGMQYVCGNHPECDYFLDSFAEDYTECLEHLGYRMEYPQITDTHYLKLICIISQKWDSFVILKGFNLDEFKREILLGLIRTKNKFYNQVRTLFEEG